MATVKPESLRDWFRSRQGARGYEWVITAAWWTVGGACGVSATWLLVDLLGWL